jgi:hypothetical protein
MSELPRDRKQQGILSDHQRVGKRFIPPFMHMLGRFQEVKWVDVPLPELFWLALLNDRHGFACGAELSVEVARAAISVLASEKKIWFGPISAYGTIGGAQRNEFIASLRCQSHLEDLKSAIAPLVALYPECPLAFIFEGEQPEENKDQHLSKLKLIIASLFDKTKKEATLMQASAIYIAFATDMLVVSPEVSLANFPAISDYPHTDETKRIGGAVRACINSFFRMSYDNSSVWPSYFWNRGLEIDQCAFETEAQNE